MKHLLAKSMATLSRSIPPHLKDKLLELKWINNFRKILYKKVGLQLLEIPDLPWKLHLYVNMDHPGERLFVTRYHERHVLDWLIGSVQIGWNIFDIGAYIGYYTIILGRLSGPEGKVIAFEPIDFLKERILNSARVNRLSNITVETLAVGNKSGFVKFWVHEDPEGGYGTSSSAHRPIGSKSVKVRMTTIDEYVNKRKLDRLDLIKIDVEGGEVQVLEGAYESLKKFRPFLILEFNDEVSKKESEIILKSLEYKWKTLGQSTYGVHILAFPK